MEKDIHEHSVSKKNQQDIAQFIFDKVKELDNLHKKDLNNLQVFELAIPSAIRKEKFGEAIALLMELMDAKQGIPWYVLPNPITKRQLLIRDARNCKHPSVSKEPYLIMAINYLRATKALFSKDKY